MGRILAFLTVALILADQPASQITATPAPGPVRFTRDTLGLQAAFPSNSDVFRNGTSFFGWYVPFSIKLGPEYSWTADGVTWSIDGTVWPPGGGSGGSAGTRSYNVGIAGELYGAFAAPRVVRAHVSLPETSFVLEWPVSQYHAIAAEAAVRIRTKRVNAGATTQPDTLSYEILQAQNLDTNIFKPFARASVSGQLSGRILPRAQLWMPPTSAQNDPKDFLALQVRHGIADTLYFLQPASDFIDSTASVGFSLEDALGAVRARFEESLRLGPLFTHAYARVYAATTPNGWTITDWTGSGDCPAGCIDSYTRTYRVSRDTLENFVVCRDIHDSRFPMLDNTVCRGPVSIIRRNRILEIPSGKRCLGGSTGGRYREILATFQASPSERLELHKAGLPTFPNTHFPISHFSFSFRIYLSPPCLPTAPFATPSTSPSTAAATTRSACPTNPPTATRARRFGPMTCSSAARPTS